MRHARGFTLIEIVVVLFILGLVLAMAAALTRSVASAQQLSNTRAALERTDLALMTFIQLAKRLPCPADGALASSDANAGREQRTGSTCDNNEARGVVPWVTLGMKEDEALDGYGTRLTYRVTPDAVVDNSLDMNRCDVSGAASAVPTSPGWCDQGCVEHAVGLPGICTPPRAALLNRGLRVQTMGGVLLNDPASATGAAYVVISPGANHGGGYGTSGALQEVTTGALSAGELANAALPPLGTYYVDDPAAGMDDVLSRSQIMGLVLKAGLGPRVHNP